MAFVTRIGNLVKQAGSKHANTGLSASNSSLYQTIRSMSSAKLFIGGLSYSTDEHGLREAFHQYGQVVEAKVVMDRDSGRSRGFGFVSFTSSEEADKALQEMDGQELHGRRVRVKFAIDKPRPSYNNYGGGGGGYGGGGYGGGGGGYGGGGYGGGNYGGDDSSNLGGYGGGDNSGSLDSRPLFDGLTSLGGGDDNSGINSRPLFDGLTSLGGGAQQSDGFQGNMNGENGGFDDEEPDGYANTRN